jgi:hypothetical protein
VVEMSSRREIEESVANVMYRQANESWIQVK